MNAASPPSAAAPTVSREGIGMVRAEQASSLACSECMSALGMPDILANRLFRACTVCFHDDRGPHAQTALEANTQQHARQTHCTNFPVICPPSKDGNLLILCSPCTAFLIDLRLTFEALRLTSIHLGPSSPSQASKFSMVSPCRFGVEIPLSVTASLAALPSRALGSKNQDVSSSEQNTRLIEPAATHHLLSVQAVFFTDDGNAIRMLLTTSQSALFLGDTPVRIQSQIIHECQSPPRSPNRRVTARTRSNLQNGNHSPQSSSPARSRTYMHATAHDDFIVWADARGCVRLFCNSTGQRISRFYMRSLDLRLCESSKCQHTDKSQCPANLCTTVKIAEYFFTLATDLSFRVIRLSQRGDGKSSSAVPSSVLKWVAEHVHTGVIQLVHLASCTVAKALLEDPSGQPLHLSRLYAVEINEGTHLSPLLTLARTQYNGTPLNVPNQALMILFSNEHYVKLALTTYDSHNLHARTHVR